jgi:hypothetical protein
VADVRCGNPCNCVSVLNNGTPTQVQILLGSNVSKNDMVTSAGFVDDTWRVNRRITLSLGLRLGRYQPGLPEQEGPAGQRFDAIDSVITFNNWGPRLGIGGDITGDGKTVVKLQYGNFWLYPGTNFTGAFNPNPTGWTRTNAWTNDVNGNGRWDAGEEGAVTSVSGGSTSTRLDGEIVNSNVHQTTLFIEREVAREMAIRTGVVINARRHPYGTININRPLTSYGVVRLSTPERMVRWAPQTTATMTAYGLLPGRSPCRRERHHECAEQRQRAHTWEMTGAGAGPHGARCSPVCRTPGIAKPPWGSAATSRPTHSSTRRGTSFASRPGRQSCTGS